MTVSGEFTQLLPPPPRELPGWTTRQRLFLYVIAAGVAALATLQLGAAEGGFAPAVPLIFAATFGGLAIVEVRRRSLLRNGIPALAIVDDVTMSRGVVRLAYRYENVQGVSALFASDCRRAFGRIPRTGDTVVVVYASANVRRSRVWGPAPPSTATEP